MARGGRLAMTVSIVLHLAVVAGLWRGPPTAVGAAPQVFEVMLTPSPERRPARPKAARAGASRPSPGEVARPPVAARTLATAGASAAVVPPAAPPPAVRAEAGPLVAPSTPGPARSVVDPFDAWSREVWAAIDRHRPRGEAGATTASVAFTLDAEGRLKGLRLAASSGSPVFDREAMRAVRAAAPFPRPPAGVDPQRLRFEAPVRASGGQAAAVAPT